MLRSTATTDSHMVDNEDDMASLSHANDKSRNRANITVPSYPMNEHSGSITIERRIARYLSKYSWYYPERDNPDVNLDDAWEYFEHITLPRRFCDKQGIANGGFEKAPKGDVKRPTRLYPVNTPQDELADFGIGVGMYFATIRALAAICFVVGLINLPVMIYYASDEYSKNQEGRTWGRLSAVCSDHKYVPCYDCNNDKWTFGEVQEQGNKYSFELKTLCDPKIEKYGWYSFVTIAAFFMFFFLLGRYQHRIEVRYDENEQTCTDYSIRVLNPPPDVFDPQEYKNYFEELTDTPVTLITIAIDNRELLSALVSSLKGLIF